MNVQTPYKYDDAGKKDRATGGVVKEYRDQSVTSETRDAHAGDRTTRRQGLT